MWFKLNDYNQCEPNKMIDGKRCIITWQINDHKISHSGKEVVEVIIKRLDKNSKTKKPQQPLVERL